MSKRLFKVATELNVGTHTIVEFLNNNGFEIEDKPNAKISEEMLSELLKEFQSSAVIKEQADQLVIGSRPVAKKESSVSVLPDGEEELPPAPSPKQEESKPEASEKPAEKPKKAEEEKEEEPTRAKPRLKVLGKIDLSEKGKAKPKSKKEEEKKAADKAPEPKPAEDKPADEPAAEDKPETAKPQVEKPKDASPAKKEAPAAPQTSESGPKEKAPAEEPTKKPGVIRAEAPELRGLKIQGKIDLDKFDSKKKKKEKEGEKKSEAKDSDTGRKRKRRRRRVAVDRQGNRQQGGRGRRSREEEVKEVSQKEIEEKIKATMARLSGGGKKKRQKMRRESRERIRERQEMREMEQQNDKLQVTEFISVQELANLMDKDATEVITACLNLGVIVSINQRLDAEIIELVASEFGFEIEFISAEEQTEEEEEIIDDPEDLQHRSPIVTVMGHVDHGKTSLLDYIRKANVASGEAGGITQHIGAYEVEVPHEGENKRITFLDTPGHEAFTAMRARGAKVTDIAVIIIAADDSIMPQTREAISHAQAAGVPIIFAINKMDKAGADPERIKQELANMNLLVEEWGGKIQSQDISAKTGQNIDELLEKVLLEAELLELQANPDRLAMATILEASLEKGRGYVAKALVQTGTLEIGDPMVAGEFSGKVKAMFNERGKRIKKAGPSKPVLILGLDGAPQAGERLKVMENEQEARSLASKRGQIAREQANRATKRISLDEIGRRIALGSFKELNLIVKGDVDGSVEALTDSLIKESIESIQVNIIHKGVGQIVDSDVMLASASDAIIIGFQVRPSLSARKLAEQEGVEIKLYSVIYNAIEEIKMAIEGMLEPTQEENIVGQVEVRETYKISKVGTVAGCYVQEGKINRNNHVRVIRDGIVIYPTKEGVVGELASLKRFKDDVKEVKNGMECGVSIKNFNDIKVGDNIEAYEIVEVKQTLA